ncbi:MAG: winged helix-turn-helix transcriptional regulator [Burkholderiaceae bacterium]
MGQLLEDDIARLRRVLQGSALNQVLLKVGDRWTWAILQQSFLGVKRFDDFQTALNIPRQTLSARLRALVADGLLRQELYQERPPRMAYRLTRMGLALYPRALIAWSWEMRWGRPPANMPRRLRHRSCGHELKPQLICETCGDELRMVDLIREVTDPGEIELPKAARARRWAGGLPTRKELLQQREIHFPKLASDRYSMMILVAVMHGCHYFDEIMKVLGLGSSVLAVRLDMLTRFGLLDKLQDRYDGRRFYYRIGAAAQALSAYMLLLSRWGQQYLLKARGTIRVRHSVCGEIVQPAVVCQHCRQPVEAYDVERL